MNNLIDIVGLPQKPKLRFILVPFNHFHEENTSESVGLHSTLA